MATPVTLDFSKAQPITPPKAQGGVTLDFSKATPLQSPIPSLPAGATAALPGVPAAPIPAGLQGPVTHSAWSGIKLGGPIDTLSNVGTHLANMVTGPFKAAFAPPADPTEMGIAAGAGNAAPVALAGYRTLVKPSIDAVSEAMKLRQAGGPRASLWAPSTYTSAGENVPTFGSKLLDAVPIYGPWARSAENETQTQGILPATAGVVTDVAGPKVLGKVGGLALRTAGKGMQLATTTPEAQSLYATRQLVPGTSGELLRSALKPGERYGAGVGQKLESSLPDVIAADPSLKGVSGFARAADTAKETAFQPYKNLLAPYRPPQALIEGQLRPAIGPVLPGTIEGTPIAEAQNASIPAINRFESPSPKPGAAPPPVRFSQPASSFRGNLPTPPVVRTLAGMPSPNEPTGIVATTAAKADIYRKPIPVATADALREDANDKLDAFYNKAGGDRKAALSNPETARIKAIGDTTREQLYPFLESEHGLPEGTVAGMQQKYGTLSEVADIANKREPVFARHDPVSLSQQVVFGHGGPIARATNWASQRLLRNLTDSDALVNSAIDRYQNPSTPLPPDAGIFSRIADKFRNPYTPLPPRPGLVPQVTSTVGSLLYGTGKGLGKISSPIPMKPVPIGGRWNLTRFPANPFIYSAAANPPRRQ